MNLAVGLQRSRAFSVHVYVDSAAKSCQWFIRYINPLVDSNSMDLGPAAWLLGKLSCSTGGLILVPAQLGSG